jgi:hypothetical protein
MSAGRHSYSKISLWMKCPRQYHAKYVLKLRDPPGPAAQRGIEIHAQFEAAVQQQLPLPDEFKFYDEYVKKLEGSNCEYKVAVDHNWQPVPFDSPDAWLVGILDLWTIRGTVGTLLDWKTGKEYPDHVFQKQFYACLIADHAPGLELINTTNVYVDQKSIKTHTFAVSQIAHMREVWAGRVAKMEAETEFRPSPGPYCRWCIASHRKGGECPN